MRLRHYNDSLADEEVGEKEYAFKHTSKDNKWRKKGPKDALYTHYGGINIIKYSTICITYNPRNKTLTGRSNRVRKCTRQKDSISEALTQQASPLYFR